MIYWPAKRPGAVLDYKFDWANALATGEAIASAVVTAGGVTIDTQSHDATSVSVKLSAGSLGTPGIVVCSITTNATPARTDEETAILPIGEEPVSLAMARTQCRADGTTVDDDYLLELIQSAREYVERYCGIRLMPVALQMTFASFAELARLTEAPVQSITQVTYLDANGVSQTLDPATYEFVNVAADVLRPRLRLAYNKSWPAARTAEDAVKVTAVAGYTAAPLPLIRAMRLLIGQWYDHRLPIAVDVRGIPTELPNTVTALFANYRR